MRFVLPLSLGSFYLGHHMIVTYGKQHYSFVPHSHANCTFCAVWTFILLSPPSAFLSEFYSSSSIHSVLLCERRIYFSAHGRRRTFGNLKFMFLILFFDMYCFFKEFWLLIASRISKIMAWDHLYIVNYLPCFLSVGLFLSLPTKY